MKKVINMNLFLICTNKNFLKITLHVCNIGGWKKMNENEKEAGGGRMVGLYNQQIFFVFIKKMGGTENTI
jgi:hypothetical protein